MLYTLISANVLLMCHDLCMDGAPLQPFSAETLLTLTGLEGVGWETGHWRSCQSPAAQAKADRMALKEGATSPILMPDHGA